MIKGFRPWRWVSGIGNWGLEAKDEGKVFKATTRVEVSHTWGSTGSGRVGTGQSGIGTCEAIKGRRKWDSGEGVGAKGNVAPKWLRIS